MSALVKNAAFAAEVAAMLEGDMARSDEVNLAAFDRISFGRRVAARMARLLTPVI